MVLLIVSLSAMALGVAAVAQQSQLSPACQECLAPAYEILKPCDTDPNCNVCEGSKLIAACEVSSCSAAEASIVNNAFATTLGGSDKLKAVFSQCSDLTPACKACIAPFDNQLTSTPTCANDQTCICAVANGFNTCQTDPNQCSAGDSALIDATVNQMLTQAGLTVTATQLKSSCASGAGTGGAGVGGGAAISASCQTCLTPFVQKLSTTATCAKDQTCVCAVANGFNACETDATKCTTADSALVDATIDAALKNAGTSVTAAQLKAGCAKLGAGPGNGTGSPGSTGSKFPGIANGPPSSTTSTMTGKSDAARIASGLGAGLAVVAAAALFAF